MADLAQWSEPIFSQLARGNERMGPSWDLLLALSTKRDRHREAGYYHSKLGMDISLLIMPCSPSPRGSTFDILACLVASDSCGGACC